MEIRSMVNNDVSIFDFDDSSVLFHRKNSEIIEISKSYDNKSELYNVLHSLNMAIGDSRINVDINTIYPQYISKMYLLLTTDCNIDCLYCTVKYNLAEYKKQYMSEATLEKSLKLLYSDGNAENKQNETAIAVE